MASKRRQSCGALLPASASIGVALQGLHQQAAADRLESCQRLQASQIWPVSAAPGGAAAGRVAATTGVCEESLLKGLNGPLQVGGRSMASFSAPVIPVELSALQLPLHLTQCVLGITKALRICCQPKAEPLHAFNFWIASIGQTTTQVEFLPPLFHPQRMTFNREAAVDLVQRAFQFHPMLIGYSPCW